MHYQVKIFKPNASGELVRSGTVSEDALEKRYWQDFRNKQTSQITINGKTRAREAKHLLNCKLPGCGKEFKAIQKNKDCCCPDHTKEFQRQKQEVKMEKLRDKMTPIVPRKCKFCETVFNTRLHLQISCGSVECKQAHKKWWRQNNLGKCQEKNKLAMRARRCTNPYKRRNKIS